jgi:hypothetical protein
MRIDILSTLRGGSTLRGASLLTTLFLAAAPASAQVQSASLTVSSPATAGPGDVIDVTVDLGSLFNVTELAAVKFAISYDADVLVPVDATTGAALGAWPSEDFVAFDGATGFVINGLTETPVTVSAGLLVTARFEVLVDAIDGAVSPLAIVGSEPGQPAILLDDLNSPSTGIKVSTTASSVTVVGGLVCTPGDVNLDGSVNAADAVVVLRSVIGLVQLDALQRCNADLDENGSIDTGDAILVLRSVVGLPKAPAAQSVNAWVEPSDGGARLVIAPASGVFGVQVTLRTSSTTFLATLDAPARGLRMDARDGMVHRIAWASAEELAAGASALSIELPLQGDRSVQVAAMQVFDANGATIPVHLEGDATPSGDRLTTVHLSNHPNPFNPSTKVFFELPSRGFARVELFNAAGQRVRVLVDGELAEGRHEVVWNGADDGGRAVASGVYFARLSSTAGEARHRLLLVK